MRKFFMLFVESILNELGFQVESFQVKSSLVFVTVGSYDKKLPDQPGSLPKTRRTFLTIGRLLGDFQNKEY